MRRSAMSRRTLLGAGACTLAAAATLPAIANAGAEPGLSSKNEELVRKYYKGWEIKDWPAFDRLLTEDFTFTSPMDAHINKSAFKKGCWDTQIPFIGHFDLEHVVGKGEDAFVMYLGHTTNGKTFRNVEYLRLKGDKVEAVECYFGAQNSYTSAVAGHK
ncbi:MAG TPA: nuclear transport factor 2 family protein [Steroidobacteraceae bacterium]|nr:nuclear transport factor 2 family protein [Steroidobacteraceae bacterium]